MLNHYKTLGLTNAASQLEIRRAYRILARRYHPDVNPDADNGEVFKSIALAYAVLSDPEKRRQYDVELKQSDESLEETFERAREALRRNQQAAAYARQQQAAPSPPKQKPHSPSSPNRSAKATSSPAVTRSPLKHLSVAPLRAIESIRKAMKFARSKAQALTPPRLKQLSVVELSISITDAIRGARRTVEVPHSLRGTKKVSVAIPPGVRTGSIIRLRSKERPDAEVVLIITVENHPWLSLSERGLTMEVPLTIAEAIEGAKIQVPSLGDPLLVTVEPLTQSGKEVRLKNQGIAARDGTRGDLYIKFIVKIPSQPLPAEIQSLTELTSELYQVPVRQHLPSRLFEE